MDKFAHEKKNRQEKALNPPYQEEMRARGPGNPSSFDEDLKLKRGRRKDEIAKVKNCYYYFNSMVLKLDWDFEKYAHANRSCGAAVEQADYNRHLDVALRDLKEIEFCVRTLAEVQLEKNGPTKGPVPKLKYHFQPDIKCDEVTDRPPTKRPAEPFGPQIRFVKLSRDYREDAEYITARKFGILRRIRERLEVETADKEQAKAKFKKAVQRLAQRRLTDEELQMLLEAPLPVSEGRLEQLPMGALDAKAELVWLNSAESVLRDFGESMLDELLSKPLPEPDLKQQSLDLT